MPKIKRGDNVRIYDGSHPHVGATGVWNGEVIEVLGKEMLKVDFHQPHHGVDGCYAKPNQVVKDEVLS